jgi:acyl-CoA thioester hydrolase
VTQPATQPSIRVERTVEWPDTDAAGHYHHSSVIRWVEAAESELHLALGLPELFGHVPRVHYEVDYLERLWFRDRVLVELRVAEVGRTSLTYDFEVCRGETPAARGRLVCVRSDPGGEGAQPWPDDVAAILRGEAPPRPSADTSSAGTSPAETHSPAPLRGA